MKTKLHVLLAAAALGATFATAQDAPPADRPPANTRPRPSPPRQDQPPRGEHEPIAPPGAPRRPDGERPRGPRDGDATRPGNERGDRPAMPQRPTPFLGIVTSPVSPSLGAQLGLPEGFGLVVDDVLPESPAKTAGVERFDVVTFFGDQRLVDPGQLAALVRAEGKDKEVALTIVRKGGEQKLTVKIGEKMLPERRASDFMNFRFPGDPQRRPEPSRGPGEDAQRLMQERMKEFQERMRDFQEKMEKWQKNPGGPMPAPPHFEPPRFGGAEPGGPMPPDVLREMRAGGAAEVKIEQDGATSRWNTAGARLVVKDDTGEVEVRQEDGHRIVRAKNPAGEMIFTSPLDTEEQRRAVPEAIRRRIDQLNVSAHSGTFSPPQPPSPGREPGPLPPSERNAQ